MAELEVFLLSDLVAVVLRYCDTDTQHTLLLPYYLHAGPTFQGSYHGLLFDATDYMRHHHTKAWAFAYAQALYPVFIQVAATHEVNRQYLSHRSVKDSIAKVVQDPAFVHGLLCVDRQVQYQPNCFYALCYKRVTQPFNRYIICDWLVQHVWKFGFRWILSHSQWTKLPQVMQYRKRLERAVPPNLFPGLRWRIRSLEYQSRLQITCEFI